MWASGGHAQGKGWCDGGWWGPVQPAARLCSNTPPLLLPPPPLLPRGGAAADWAAQASRQGPCSRHGRGHVRCTGGAQGRFLVLWGVHACMRRVRQVGQRLHDLARSMRAVAVSVGASTGASSSEARCEGRTQSLQRFSHPPPRAEGSLRQGPCRPPHGCT